MEELEKRIAEREKTRWLPRWARRVLFWSGVAVGVSAVGVAIYQSQEKKRVPVRMAWQFALRDDAVQQLLAVPPNDDGMDAQGNRLMLVPPFWRSWIVPSGYEVSSPEFNFCSAVSYSCVPVYAPTGATGYIISEAVRFGGPADWRVDYVEFVLTRAPSRPLYDPDGSVSKQRASPPTIFTFHGLSEAERKSVVLFDRRQPTQLAYTFAPTFLHDVVATERRIALRNLFPEPAQAAALQRAIAASDAGATVDNAAAIGNGLTEANNFGARVTETPEGRVGEKYMSFRNTMAWWVRYRAHRWSMIFNKLNYPAPRLEVESPKYDDRVGS